MKKITTKQLCIDAMLAALCAVLGYFAIDMLSIKITFEGVPVLIGALLFGPIDGVLIGGVGTFIYQVIRYGISATTALWILPYLLYGLVLGFFAKKNKFNYSKKFPITVVIVLGEMLITAVNTLAIFVDSKIYGYYSVELITGALGLRILICVVKAAVFAIIMPSLIKAIQKALNHSSEKEN